MSKRIIELREVNDLFDLYLYTVESIVILYMYMKRLYTYIYSDRWISFIIGVCIGWLITYMYLR